MIEIAKWIRRKRRKNIENDSSADVQITLFNREKNLEDLVDEKETQDFIRRKCQEYRLMKKNEPNDAEIHHNLGCLLRYIRPSYPLHEIIENFSSACDMEPKNNKYKWFLYQALNEQAYKNFIAAARCLNVKQSTQPIDIHDSTLSYQDFMKEYAMKGIPVIIRNGAKMAFSQDLSLSYLQKMTSIIHKNVPVKTYKENSTKWASLEDAPFICFGALLEEIISGSDTKLYLHDCSIPRYFPELLRYTSIPKYFAGDFLQRLDEDHPYRDTWPSLFVGPKNTQSNTHIDSFGSNFWMALFQGRKHWILVDRKDIALLGPKWQEHSMDVTFSVALEEDKLHAEGLYCYAKRYECVLEPGDLLFVPSGTPHRVRNLDDTVAVSGNYIDSSNWCQAMKACLVQGWRDEHSTELGKALRALSETPLHQSTQLVQPPSMCSNPLTLSWDAYKKCAQTVEQRDIKFHCEWFDDALFFSGNVTKSSSFNQTPCQSHLDRVTMIAGIHEDNERVIKRQRTLADEFLDDLSESDA